MRAPLIVLALASAAGAALFARPAQPPGSPPTFRADTHLVEVSVTVHDENGQPISGLTREDFTLLDEGREQPIDVFSVEGASGGSAAAANAPMPAGFSSGDFTNQLG